MPITAAQSPTGSPAILAVASEEAVPPALPTTPVPMRSPCHHALPTSHHIPPSLTSPLIILHLPFVRWCLPRQFASHLTTKGFVIPDPPRVDPIDTTNPTSDQLNLAGTNSQAPKVRALRFHTWSGLQKKAAIVRRPRESIYPSS